MVYPQCDAMPGFPLQAHPIIPLPRARLRNGLHKCCVSSASRLVSFRLRFALGFTCNQTLYPSSPTQWRRSSKRNARSYHTTTTNPAKRVDFPLAQCISVVRLESGIELRAAWEQSANAMHVNSLRCALRDS